MSIIKIIILKNKGLKFVYFIFLLNLFSSILYASDVLDEAGMKYVLSRSMLSQQDIEKGISFFKIQHDNWLAIKSGQAKYTTDFRELNEGVFVSEPALSQQGSLEFTVLPMENLIGLQSPAKIQARLSNDSYQWNFLKTNVFDGNAVMYQWTDDATCPIEGEMAAVAKKAFEGELFFFPFDLMSKTYVYGPWDNRYTIPQEEFFKDRGFPFRLSTEEETRNLFQGEPQYLFLLSPALTDAYYWFSANSGELRQIDFFAPDGVIKSFRYENYVQNNNLIFPQRAILIWKQSTDNETIGWEHIVEFTEIKLNIEIPSERFSPPF